MKEALRRTTHIVFGLIAIILIYFNMINTIAIFGLIVAGSIFSVICCKKRLPIIGWFLEQLERYHHMKNFPGRGAVFYLIGIFLALRLFSKDIAIASIMILAIGDAVSPIIGGTYGKILHPFSSKKFIEGTIAGAFAAFIGALILKHIGMIQINSLHAFAASFVAMFVEGIELKFGMDLVDDNMIIPLVAGTVMWLYLLM